MTNKQTTPTEDRVVMQSGCTKPSGVCQADLVLSPVSFEISPKGYDAIAIDRTDYVLFHINVSILLAMEFVLKIYFTTWRKLTAMKVVSFNFS